MKSEEKTSKDIEVSVWQLITIGVAVFACVFTLVPILSNYHVQKCSKLETVNEETIETIWTDDNLDKIQPEAKHHRYEREIKNEQCGIIPPTCLATTTQRSTASTISVTRPPITTAPFTNPTTTRDPWANTTRPYNSWRLPTFAVPSRYALSLSCPACFDLTSTPSVLHFDGHVAIDFNLTNTSTFLVLHIRKLNITRAEITSEGPVVPKVTYLPEFEMVHLDFSPTTLAVGSHRLEIKYDGEVNQVDQIGFYREIFWKTNYQLSYVLGANFHPIHARNAFPCFDEPQLTAEFALIFNHHTNETRALSNVDVDTTNTTSTTFKVTPKLSTHELTWAILPLDEFVLTSRSFSSINVSIWIRDELVGPSAAYLDFAFDVIDKTIGFAATYLSPSPSDLPDTIDIIGVPDFVVDEKALTNLGLITFREEFLSCDPTLYSAERRQTTAQILAEHILQLWFTKVDWWNNVWFGKSMSKFLSYKVIGLNYPVYHLMEQFAVREITPFMMDDMKPSSWRVSNKNLTNNQDIIESLSPLIYSKGASILRLVDYIVGEEQFKNSLISSGASSNKPSKLNDFYAALGSDNILNSTTTAESMIRSWVEEQNYPVVTVEFNPTNESNPDLRLAFRQNRFTGNYFGTDSGINLNYIWRIYMECQLGGSETIDFDNSSGLDDVETIQFVLDTETKEIILPNSTHLWIKCNKDFYSFLVTDYDYNDFDRQTIWERFESLTYENILSNNDKANILNDGFVLPHGKSLATFDRTISFFRRFFDPTENYVPWSVFLWHWNYLLPIEERSSLFYNFKQFATRQSYAAFSFSIDNLVQNVTDHRSRLMRAAIFDLLCRVQNTNALQKATDLFNKIPKEYFTESIFETNVGSDFLSSVVFYHLQNVNFIDEWDELFSVLSSNGKLTSLQRQTIVRGLSASKELWRLKYLLDFSMNDPGLLIETQEFLDIFATISANSAGRDVAWNFYRQNYPKLLEMFGTNNRIFNQLINSIAQSFENEFYFEQMQEFILKYRSPSPTQKQALDQILINFQWLGDGLANELDVAITTIDRAQPKKISK